MTNFFKAKRAVIQQNRTRTRLQRLTLPELYDWSEAVLYQTGRSFSAWRKGGGLAALDDADKQIAALSEVCREIRAREQARS